MTEKCTECENVLNGQLQGITCLMCQESWHFCCADINPERMKAAQNALSEDSLLGMPIRQFISAVG